jgi:hypothetical protein
VNTRELSVVTVIAAAVATDRHRRDAVLSPVTRGVRHDRLPTACRLLEATECREFRVGSGWNPKNRCQSPPSDTGFGAKVLVRGLRGWRGSGVRDAFARVVPAYEFDEGVGVVPLTPVSGLRTSRRARESKRGLRGSARDGATTRRYSRLAEVLSLELFGCRDGGVLCDVDCEAELADDADFVLAAGMVASAEPSFFADGSGRHA